MPGTDITTRSVMYQEMKDYLEKHKEIESELIAFGILVLKLRGLEYLESKDFKPLAHSKAS
jgi:hypothetical protein